MRSRATVILVLTAYAFLALGYNLVVPAGEAPDEPTHLDYVYFLRTQRALPHMSEPGGSGITQGGHPPLYYALAAALTAWSPPRPPRWVSNPHFTFNLERTLAPNAFIHVQEPGLPYRGAPELAALHGMRLLSLLSCLVLIAATYLVAGLVWPDRPCVAWASAAVAAFVPGLAFSGGVFNNDSMAAAFAAVTVLAAIRVALGHAARRDLLLLGTALGLGMLAKMTTASLAAVAGLAVLVHVWRRRDWWVVGRAAICVGAPILVLNGWWLVRNMRLYGANDPMGWKMFVRAGPSMLRTLPIRDEIGWYVRHQFASFWGSFGWTTVRMPDWAYMAYGVLLASAVVGLGLLLLRRARLAADTRWGLALLAAAVIVGYASVFRLFFSFNMVVAHGRYLYPLLTPLAVLVATGISELLPATRRRAVLGALAVAMAVGSAACLLLVVRPAFALPQPVAVEAPTGSAASAGTGTVFDGRFRLVRHSLSSERLTAGQPVTVTLDWEALPANWQPFPSVSRAEIGFVHIVGADGEVIARVDQMPFGGVHPTLAWRPGHVYRQAVKLNVAPDAVTGSGAVLIGWYPENEPQSRLPVSVDGQPAGDTVRLEHVVIRPGTPVTLDGVGATARADRLGQGQGTRLAGYRVDGQVRPGGTVTITLFWQPDAPVGADLAVFVHAVGSDGVPLATGDGPPQGGRYPMWLWAPGEIVPDAHVLALPAGTSLADVSLRVGWYDPASGQRAPAVRYDGAPWADNAVELPLVGSP